ncbi:MAG: UDP-N-acetylmuramate dehydrogenase [Oscillospiraceae bacterium]|jgi:UDP-N-acetylmuramate dehydrogenase|nr:UDP-N-acetylmuramate dehydrogenase [Oscillospiraceae bacterium]MBR3084666.1 UDP-N-acetylmuramate dehydrogenase [Oscillospiraceae bacterium]
METRLLALELKRALPGLRLLEGEPMAAHCSFRIGGPAALFAEPSDEAELLALLAALRERGVRPLLLGKGTNVLVADAGVPGVVVHIGEALGAVRVAGTRMEAGAGVALSVLAQRAREHSLTGLEFAHGIPGSLGGAVVMNAGAYDGEMKDVVVSVRYLDGEGTLRETEDMGFAYRRSRFSDGQSVVLSAVLQLREGDGEAVAARMRELGERRRSKQPLDRPSAGSTFKRPARGYAAALIEGAGLKGLSVGGAQVSEKHAGFVINTGNASCADVLALMELVRARVLEKYGVELEPEVRIVG